MRKINVSSGYSPMKEFDSAKAAIEEPKSSDRFVEALRRNCRIEEIEWTDTTIKFRLEDSRSLLVSIANDQKITECEFKEDASRLKPNDDECLLLRFISEESPCNTTYEWNRKQVSERMIGEQLLQVYYNSPHTFIYISSNPTLMVSVCWDTKANRPLLFWSDTE